MPFGLLEGLAVYVILRGDIVVSVYAKFSGVGFYEATKQGPRILQEKSMTTLPLKAQQP